MTEVHVIKPGNRHLYGDIVESLFRLRHDVFVDERGWERLRRPDGRDVDAYDDEHAIYLVALEGERVVGGQRLYPTLRPHMLSEVFPHLASRTGVIQSPDVYEWTRYFVVRERRGGRTDCRLLAALQAFCLDEGISRVTAVVEAWWLPRWHQVGFRSRPLGLPEIVEGQPTLAAAIDIAPESLASVRAFAGLKGPALGLAFPTQPLQKDRFDAAH